MKENSIVFVTGIGTDVGKTVVSAILAEARSAQYWKPVQAGDLDNSDSHKVARYCSDRVRILPEKHRLKTPMSPHGAAALEGIAIRLEDFDAPDFSGNLIIEGAGGLLVPMNEEGLSLADVLQEKKWPCVLVSRHYLGSINHTLLSLEVMKQRQIPIEGIIFVGDEYPSSESIIEKIGGVRILGRIPLADEVNSAFVQEQAKKLTF